MTQTNRHVVIQIEEEDVVQYPREATTNRTSMMRHRHGAHSTKRGRKKVEKPEHASSTLKRFADFAFPQVLNNFLFGEEDVFKISKFFFGFSVGSLIGFALYLTLIDALELNDVMKILLLFLLSVTCACGWGLSINFRCTTLIIVPNVLGKEGRALLYIIAFAAIYAGPYANFKHNFSEFPRTIGCTAELQINNTKMLWKILSEPVKSILRNVRQETSKFKGIGEGVKSSFTETKEEVEGKSGYDVQKEEQLHQKKRVSTTQQKFDIKTMLRCEYIIGLGITKCEEWFERKHEDCMRAVAVPLINNLLCLPMKFSFLCGILNIGESWCKKHIPIESHFGEIYDQTSSAVTNVGSGISSKMVIEKEEEVGAGENITKISLKDKILSAIERRSVILEAFTSAMKHILALSFIYIFYSAFHYTKQYNSDIQHDNCYVTTYFKQIDARRRKQKKRYLLPMKKGETSRLIFPFSLKVQGPEMSSMYTELRQCIYPIIFLIMTVIFDRILFYILAIIRKHSLISYVFASHHKLEVQVGGDTLLANILRKTIGALNSTSSTYLTSNNEMCLPKPTELIFWDYALTCLPIFGLVLLSVLQVYFYRVRRVVASYYFPEREKKRITFLYNEQLRRRAIYTDVKRKQVMTKARINRQKMKTNMGDFFRHYTKWMKRFIRRRCIVCDRSETKKSFVCPTPDCESVYCRQCWRDMKKFCFACKPYEDFIVGPDYSDSE